MNDLRQAAEMALEALEEATTQDDSIQKWDRHALAIEAIRQALAQIDCGFDRTASHMAGEYVDTVKPKREWVDLTDEEIAEAVGSPLDEVYLSDFHKVIAKLKEKKND